MILGLGTDLIDVRRIEKTLEKFGDRFLNRIFTDEEKRIVNRKKIKKSAYSSYAMRFAAKEACSKALGTGLRQGVFWRDMTITHLMSGKPEMVLFGGAAEKLDELTPSGMKAQINVSMTDDYPWAQAVVIISTIPQ
ncbi:MAG: holo-ACP synthase [Alphaproteobacteria bacterium]|nr:holo-ACP synthase [Alphaproteobacteria bacterium]